MNPSIPRSRDPQRTIECHRIGANLDFRIDSQNRSAASSNPMLAGFEMFHVSAPVLVFRPSVLRLSRDEESRTLLATREEQFELCRLIYYIGVAHISRAISRFSIDGTHRCFSFRYQNGQCILIHGCRRWGPIARF